MNRRLWISASRKKSISAILHPHHIRVCEIAKVVRSQFHLHRIWASSETLCRYKSIAPSGFHRDSIQQCFLVLCCGLCICFCLCERTFIDTGGFITLVLGCCVSDEEIKEEEPLKQITPGCQHTWHARTINLIRA